MEDNFTKATFDCCIIRDTTIKKAKAHMPIIPTLASPLEEDMYASAPVLLASRGDVETCKTNSLIRTTEKALQLHLRLS